MVAQQMWQLGMSRQADAEVVRQAGRRLPPTLPVFVQVPVASPVVVLATWMARSRNPGSRGSTRGM